MSTSSPLRLPSPLFFLCPASVVCSPIFFLPCLPNFSYPPVNPFPSAPIAPPLLQLCLPHFILSPFLLSLFPLYPLLTFTSTNVSLFSPPTFPSLAHLHLSHLFPCILHMIVLFFNPTTPPLFSLLYQSPFNRHEGKRLMTKHLQHTPLGVLTQLCLPLFLSPNPLPCSQLFLLILLPFPLSFSAFPYSSLPLFSVLLPFLLNSC